MALAHLDIVQFKSVSDIFSHTVGVELSARWAGRADAHYFDPERLAAVRLEDGKRAAFA